MKVTGTGGLSQTSGARPARAAGAGAGAGFRIAGAPASATAAQVSSTAGVGNVMGVEALIALQEVETSTERRRRSVGRASLLLDEMDEIKIALLGGELGSHQLQRLTRTIREQRSATEDPKLEAVLDEIETRAAVELAKLETQARAA